jgi:hypothetical protein
MDDASPHLAFEPRWSDAIRGSSFCNFSTSSSLMAAVRFVSPRYFLATSTAFLAWLRLRLERSSSSVDLEMLTNVSARLSSAEMNWCRRASRSLLNASYCESLSIHASRSGCLVRTLQMEFEPGWNRFDSNDSCIVLCEKLVSNPAACAGPLRRKETIPVDTPGYSHVKLWT